MRHCTERGFRITDGRLSSVHRDGFIERIRSIVTAAARSVAQLCPLAASIIMSTSVRMLIVAVIASVMAVVGMELIALRDGNHTNLGTLKIVIPISIFVWLVLSLVLRQRPVLLGIYVGFLSPFLGGILAIPPYGLIMVLTNLAICIGVGIVTGVLVALALRGWGDA